MGREFRLAELVGVVRQMPLLTAQMVVTECTHMTHFSAGLGDLLNYLCGELSQLEMSLAFPAVQEELIRQHSWLLDVWMPHPESWAHLWAWLDTMETKHGAVHEVDPLPEDWRGSIKLSSYTALALNTETGEPRTVTWEDLPELLQLHLRNLGYDAST
jgi:hypothetical protein